MERREAPSRRTGGKASRLASATDMPVTRLRRSAAPSFGEEGTKVKRKQGTRAQKRAAGTKKGARRRQGYGGFAYLPAEASEAGARRRRGYGGLAYLPAEASAKAGALFDIVNRKTMRVGSRGRSESETRTDASRRDHPAFRPAT